MSAGGRAGVEGGLHVLGERSPERMSLKGTMMSGSEEKEERMANRISSIPH